MNPSRLFIERPVATSLAMVAIVLAGALGYFSLSVSALPEVDYPTIEITTLYPGASPDVITSSITAPLERQFGQVPGLAQMSSTSSGGASVITLRFSLDITLDVAEQEVQAAINAAGNLLPTDLPMPPVYAKVNPADAPDPDAGDHLRTVCRCQTMEDFVDTRLAPKLSDVPGVGLVSIAGGQRPAVRIQIDPAALAATGLALEDVRTAIGNANVNEAKGSFDGSSQASTIDANDQLRSAADYRSVVLAYRNGAAIHLTDVGKVIDGAENSKLAAWAGINGRTVPAVIVNVQRQPGSNVIGTVNRVRALLPQLRASLPGALDITLLADRTDTIRASVRDVQFELSLSIALVVLVIFLFLRSVPATIIPSVVVPVSIVGTFGVMYLAGFSINNLTIMALTIATGFVVDDAIVMIENISRYVEQGVPPAGGGAQGIAADRLHDHLADRLADCGADPAVVHARGGRPAVSGICHHAGHFDRDLGDRFADPDADDVRAPAQAPGHRPSGAAGCGAPANGSSTSPRPTAGACASCWRTARATLAVAVGDAAADHRCSTFSSPRAFSRCRTPARCRGSPRRRRPSRLPPWPTGNRRSRACCCRTPRSPASPRSSASTASTRP